MTITHEVERCPMCGADSVSEPEHAVRLADLMRELDCKDEPDSRNYAEHRWHDAKGHKWTSSWEVEP